MVIYVNIYVYMYICNICIYIYIYISTAMYLPDIESWALQKWELRLFIVFQTVGGSSSLSGVYVEAPDALHRLHVDKNSTRRWSRFRRIILYYTYHDICKLQNHIYKSQCTNITIVLFQAIWDAMQRLLNESAHNATPALPALCIWYRQSYYHAFMILL